MSGLKQVSLPYVPDATLRQGVTGRQAVQGQDSVIHSDLAPADLDGLPGLQAEDGKWLVEPSGDHYRLVSPSRMSHGYDMRVPRFGGPGDYGCSVAEFLRDREEHSLGRMGLARIPSGFGHRRDVERALRGDIPADWVTCFGQWNSVRQNVTVSRKHGGTSECWAVWDVDLKPAPEGHATLTTRWRCAHLTVDGISSPRNCY